jgi:hypothetical protein
MLVVPALEWSCHPPEQVSSALAFFSLLTHWTDPPPPCIGPDDMPSQATTVVDPVDIPATTSQELLSFLSLAISSSPSHRSSTSSSSSMSQSLQPPSIAAVYSTCTLVSRRHPSFLACVPPTVRRHVNVARALAAATGPLWAAWIHAGTLCPGRQVTVLLGHVLKSAYWPLNSFSIFLNIFKSLQVQNFV